MQVNLTHSTVKRARTLTYVNADVRFSEEEKAIIRARALGDHELPFETGFLNLKPDAFSNAPLGIIQSAARFLFMFGLLAFLAYLASPRVGALPWVILWGSSIALFIYRKRVEGAQKTLEKEALKVKELLKGPFSLCTTDATAVSLLEEEIKNNLTLLKDWLTSTAEAPTAKSFEI